MEEAPAGAETSSSDSGCTADGGTLPSLPRSRPNRTNAFPRLRRSGPGSEGRADWRRAATRTAASSLQISGVCGPSIASSSPSSIFRSSYFE
jgi:hypothetical protein